MRETPSATRAILDPHGAVMWRVATGLIALFAALVYVAQQAPGAGAGVSSARTSAAAASVPLAAAAQAGSIIVVRRAGGRDALWRVAPTDGSATKLVDLTFRPWRIEPSPDGARLALLPRAAGPRVYVCDVAGATVKALSLAPRGVRWVDSLTWLSPTRLLVAGSAGATQAKYPLADRLYLLNGVTGASAPFRGGLRGTEPTAATRATRLVYVRLADAGPNPSQPGTRLISEQLVSLKLASGTTPRVIARARYTDSLDMRSFRDPRISPAGRYVITSTTGPDVSVSYMVRLVSTGKAFFTKHTTLSRRDATAWRPQGGVVSFWGMPPAAAPTTTRIYTYDIGAPRLTSAGPFSNVTATGLSWSPDGTRIAFTLSALASAVDVAALWTADPNGATAPVSLGPGSLPAWLP